MLDAALSTALLALLAPLLALVGFAVRVTLGKGVVFRQARPGLGGTPFTLLKFRTMREIRGPSGLLLPDQARLTAFGSFLRRTSLDELPGLWNVLRGDLSLVGPRPLLMEYLELYTPPQARRHQVRPGITGWAQVNGRNVLSWEERFEHDAWYVDHLSLALDLRILAATVWKVLRSEAISAPGHATMPEFRSGPGER